METLEAEGADNVWSRCIVCGQPVLEIRCKLICPRCGFTRDCSDP